MSTKKDSKRYKAEHKAVSLRVSNKKHRIKKTKLTSRAMLAMIERRRKVIIMRRDGWSYDEIAQAVGASVSTIQGDIQYCLEVASTELIESAEHTRELQKSRLDALLKANMPFAVDSHQEVRRDKMTGKEFIVVVPPDPAYANVILKVEERRAKLLALDIPEVKKVEVSGIREYVGIDLEKI